MISILSNFCVQHRRIAPLTAVPPLHRLASISPFSPESESTASSAKEIQETLETQERQEGDLHACIC